MRSAIAVPAIWMVAALLATPARADTQAGNRAVSALPGVHRVITADPFTSRELSIASSAGFGLSRGVVCPSDTHSRTLGSLALGLDLRDWLALSMRLDGRHDRMTCAAAGRTSWTVASPSIQARAHRFLGKGLHAGGQLRIWLPADRGLTVDPGATTVEALAALSLVTLDARLRVAGNLGFTLDRSGELADRYFMPTRVERISLGASDSNAVLMGVGATYALGRTQLLAEWTWDLHVGEDAPSLSVSPMRVATGVRVALTDSLSAQLVIEANLAEPPTGAAADPLSPFESTVSAMVGLHYRARIPALSWPWATHTKPTGTKPTGTKPTGTKPTMDPVDPHPHPDPDPNNPAPDPPPDKPEPAALTGQVIDQLDGIAVAGAEVTVTLGSTTRTALTNEQGRFEIPDLDAGHAVVEVHAPDFETARTETELHAGQTGTVELTLAPRVPPPQLRVQVRSGRGGRPLKAQLLIEPAKGQPDTLQTMAAKTEASGFYAIDLAPGRYTVVIRADGYREQRHRVNVKSGEVTILNVDMSRKR